MAHTGWPTSETRAAAPDPKALAEAMKAEIAQAKARGAKARGKAKPEAEGTAEATVEPESKGTTKHAKAKPKAKRAATPAAKGAARLRPADEEEEDEEDEESPEEDEWDEDSEEEDTEEEEEEDTENQDEEEEGEEEAREAEQTKEKGKPGKGKQKEAHAAASKAATNIKRTPKQKTDPPQKRAKLQHLGAVPPRPSMPTGDEEVRYRSAGLLLHINTRGENTWRVFVLATSTRATVNKLRQFGTKGNPRQKRRRKLHGTGPWTWSMKL